MKNNNLHRIFWVAILTLSFAASIDAQTFSSGGGSSNYYRSTIGKDNNALGNYSFAGGRNSTSNGAQSFAFGFSASASGMVSTAIGYNTEASEIYSMALGTYLKASKPYSYVFGIGKSGTPLESPDEYTISFGVNSNKPTMILTKAKGNSFTGSVGIGNITTPKAKLHIVSDDNEDAGIILQPTNPNKNTSFIQFVDNTNVISVKTNDKMDFKANRFRFGNGNGTKITLQNGFKGGGSAIFSNAYLVGATYMREDQGSSYAIEFNNDALRIRTAVNQIPRGTEITNWKDALFLMTNGKVGIGSISTYLENYNEQEFRIASPKMITLSSSDLIFNPSRAFVVNGTVNATRGIETGNLVATGDVVLSGLASASSEDILVVGTDGSVSTTSISACGDNLGNHTAENNLNMNGQWIVGSLTSVRGIFIGTNGNVKLGTIGQGVLGNPETALEVDGTVYSTALEVNGRIRSKEVVVESSGWSDFVFENDYNMMSLKDVEDYINEHGHLPNVPSAEEIEENGINVSEMNAILLQKIEELTLHLIEAEKRIEELERR